MAPTEKMMEVRRRITVEADKLAAQIQMWMDCGETPPEVVKTAEDREAGLRQAVSIINGVLRE